MKRFVVFLALVAFLNGALWSARNWGKTPSGDGNEYHQIALALLQGRGFGEQNAALNSRDPGYPFFLMLVYSVFGVHAKAVHMIELLMYAGICIIMYFIARTLYRNELIAKLAGAGAALFYPLAAIPGTFYTEILFTFFLVSSILSLVALGQQRSVRQSAMLTVAAGALFGAAMLTRSIVIFFPFLLLAWTAAGAIFSKTRDEGLIHLRRVLVFTATCACIVLPWMFYNHAVTGVFAVSDRSGTLLDFTIQRIKISNRELPKVFVANTLGDFFAIKIFSSYDRMAIEEGSFNMRAAELAALGLSYDEVNRQIRKESLVFARAHPLRYFLVAVPIEFLKLHTPIFPFTSMQGLFSDPRRYAYLPDAAKGTIIIIVRLAYLCLFAGAAYGFWKCRAAWRAQASVVLLVCYLVGMYSIIHGISRYLVPVYPFYIMWCGYGIIQMSIMRKSLEKKAAKVL